MAWLTNLEFTTAPTSVSVADLVLDGSGADQDAELARQLARACAWCDNFVNQPLQAAVRTHTERVYVGRSGLLALHPGPWPLVSLSSLATGTTAADLVAVSNLSGVWVEDETFFVPATAIGASSITPIQLSGRTGSRMLARYSYVSGFAHTTLAAIATQGATSITVASTVGVTAGDTLTIVDGSSTEQVTVTAVTSSTVLAVSALAYAHTYAAGVGSAIAVHGFPEEVKQAGTWVAAANIKLRGTDSLVMTNTLQAGPVQGLDPVTQNGLRFAREVLYSYRRVR